MCNRTVALHEGLGFLVYGLSDCGAESQGAELDMGFRLLYHYVFFRGVPQAPGFED